MTVQLISITDDVAARMQELTTPTPSQVGDARMVLIDLLGTGPSWPLAVLVDRVCIAYEAPVAVDDERVERAVRQEALGQGQRHLRVVGEGAGRQPVRLHRAHEVIQWDGPAEFQRHAQGVADGRADRDAAQAILEDVVHGHAPTGQSRTRLLVDPGPFGLWVSSRVMAYAFTKGSTTDMLFQIRCDFRQQGAQVLPGN